ncbi:MAG: protein kinase [Deltaproteobacteria bacterium]|nr:protein kinase [Deltaproteobacteria bacterium]
MFCGKGEGRRWYCAHHLIAPQRGDETLAAPSQRDEEAAALGAPPPVDRYHLGALLGRGGAGAVYLAEDPLLHRKVALKILVGGAYASPQATARFMEEARATARLDHPGVVRVLDVGRTADHALWYAMEVVEGPSLAEVLASGGPLPQAEALRIFTDLVEIVDYVHSQGIAHRDLKPSNVLLTQEGAPRLIDFGVAMDHAAERAPLTVTGQIPGTPAYMAPELLGGSGAGADWFRADLWSLTALFQEMLTGSSPSSDLAPALPWHLADVLARGLDPDPATRIPSTRAMLATLRSPRPRPSRLHLPVSALLVPLGLGAAALWLQRSSPPPAEEPRPALQAAQAMLELENIDEAEALIQRYSASASPQEVGAVWLAWAELLQAHQHPREANQAYGRAWVEGEGPEQEAALLQLARDLHRRGELHALRVLLRDRPLPAGALGVSPEALEDQVDFAELRLDLVSARGGPLASVARALRSGTPVQGEVESYWQVIQGPTCTDTGPSLITWRAEGPTRETVARRLDARDGAWRTYPLEDAPPCSHLVGSPLLLPSYRDGVQRLLRLDAGGVHPISAGPRPMGLTGWTHDEGGVVGVMGGYIRQLERWDVQGGRGSPHPPTDALGSYITGIVSLQADGDPARELVVAAGPPLAYALRLLDDGQPMTLVNTLATGYVCTLEAVHLDERPAVVYGTCPVHPSPAVFPEPPHLGPPAAVYISRIGPTGLQAPTQLPLPDLGDRGEVRRVLAADLDGDGTDEVIANLHAADGRDLLALWHHTPAEGWSGALVRDWIATGVAQLDEDPGLELLALSHPTFRDVPEGSEWIWGLGDTPLPSPSGAPISPDASPSLQRAQVLAAVGLPEAAASAMLQLSAHLSSPAQAAQAHREAAALWEQQGDLAKAASARELAATLGDRREEDLRRAADDWLGAAALSEALRVSHLLSAPLVIQPQLEALVDAAPALQTSALVQALRDHSPVPAAARPRSRTSQQLVLQAVTGAGALSTVPLRWTGAPRRLRLTLYVQRVEWGSRLGVRLHPRGASPEQGMFTELRGMGGGGELYHRLDWGELYSTRVDRPDTPARVELELVEIPGLGWHTRGTWDGEPLKGSHTPVTLASDQDWELVLDAPGEPGLEGPLVEATLESLQLWGFDLGEGEVAPVSPETAELVHARLFPMNVDTQGEGGWRDLNRAWSTAITSHPQDHQLYEAVRGTTREALRASARSPEARAFLTLLGRAAWEQGDEAAAQQALEGALRSTSRGEEARFTLCDTLLEVALAADDPEGADRAVRCMADEQPERTATLLQYLRRREGLSAALRLVLQGTEP